MLLYCGKIFTVIAAESEHLGKVQRPLKVAKGKLAISNFKHEHILWHNILKKNVKMSTDRSSSTIDYKSINRQKLDLYIANALAISNEQFKKWSKNQKLSYYINLYNALTVKKILAAYPVKSIKDLHSGFPFYTSPWKIKFFKLFGEDSHLDHIEHTLVRASGEFNDPRIHFAFNCASIGCPALVDEAFVAAKLDLQLETALKHFLKDKKRNYFDVGKNKLILSKIFQWYRQDFEKGHRGFTSLEKFLSLYSQFIYGLSKKNSAQLILEKKIGIDFQEYNWNLNDIQKIKK